MAESVEHAFLSSSILSILETASNSKLYAYREADRKRFDFSCDLATSWKRVAAGQTLWKHSEGVDKDIRILLSEPETDVLIYVARDTMKNRALLHEVVSDFKRTALGEKLPRLRVFWVPEGFDADKDDHRKLIYETLRESVSRDLLLAIVLGGITQRDVREFASWSGTAGISLAALAQIERAGFTNYTQLGKELGVSANLAKDRHIRLSLTGLIDHFEISPKGRVLMDLCGRLYRERHREGMVDEGLSYVCSLLGLDVKKIDLWNERYCGYRSTPDGRGNIEPIFYDVSAQLGRQIYDAVSYWGVDLPDPHYVLP